MTTNTSAAEKRTAVDYLEFSAKTAKRVSWESWEFTIVGPHQIRVTNASYGYLKSDHAYTVGVEEREGLAVPSVCDCPADKYHEEYACKHKVALATVGGPIVLNAAIEYESPKMSEPETMIDKIRADGGVAVHADTSTTENDCDCARLSDGLPCWPCVRDRRRKLPE